MCALHSEELYVKVTPGNSLDDLGLHIDDEFQCRYHPWLLRKNKTTQSKILVQGWTRI